MNSIPNGLKRQRRWQKASVPNQQGEEYAPPSVTENYNTTDCESYYRAAATIQFLEHVLRQIDERFNSRTEKIVQGYVLVPRELIRKVEKDGDSSWKPVVRDLVSQYPDDFPNKFKLDAEMEIYLTYWKSENERLLTLRTNVRPHTSTDKGDELELPKSIAETLKAIRPIKDIVPTIVKALRLLGTIPVTACECERCNSSLKRLKTYTRSTVGQERMDSLALSHIHRFVNVNTDNIIDEFARRNPRRLEFARILDNENRFG